MFPTRDVMNEVLHKIKLKSCIDYGHFEAFVL